MQKRTLASLQAARGAQITRFGAPADGHADNQDADH